MAAQFRIVDLRVDPDNPRELSVARASSPEHAAKLAIGETLVRGGHHRDLRVRVYFQHDGQPTTMVRLYRRVEDRV